ncbi:hypothetical protein AB0I69_42685 [Streptomyces sp. NPDC050508]|uniref:hypothetical protein n=1 Tax=Streptomyces sp. NPDC050508 TaxID=3155405 RepID=UPI0034397125
MNTATMPRNFAAKVFGRLMSAAFLSQQHALTDLGPFTGLLWRCVCKELNTPDLNACGGCHKARLWTKDATPPRYEYGTLLEDLRSALTEWFDDRPKIRRPAAISFRVTTEYDDGPAWATWDTTAYFTDSPTGQTYGEDFERSFVSEALVEIGNFDRPQVGDTLRVAIPSPFTEPAEDARSTEYAYTISEYAREAATVLGEGWDSESGYIGAYGKLWGPGVPTLRVYVDEWDDLVVALHDDADPMRFTVDLPNGAPSYPYELRAVGEDIAEIIRANFC